MQVESTHPVLHFSNNTPIFSTMPPLQSPLPLQDSTEYTGCFPDHWEQLPSTIAINAPLTTFLSYRFWLKSLICPMPPCHSLCHCEPNFYIIALMEFLIERINVSLQSAICNQKLIFHRICYNNVTLLFPDAYQVLVSANNFFLISQRKFMILHNI